MKNERRTHVASCHRQGEHTRTRLFAVTVVMGAAAALEQGVVEGEDLSYFAVCVVLFLVGLLAIRLPALFWTPAPDRRPEAQPSREEKVRPVPVVDDRQR